MASTPLYKHLKKNGTTFYAFPGAAEDISAAYQNDNNRMNFSKFALLNIPTQSVTELGDPDINYPPKMDFYNNSSALKSPILTPGPPAIDLSEQLVESLRNYVANQEVTIKGTKTGNNDFFYDNNVLSTNAEHIFLKWCRKLNIIDFDPAISGDEYFGNLIEFERNNINDDLYLPEFLWKERETKEFRGVTFSSSSNKLIVDFDTTTNFRVGDVIYIDNGIETTTFNDKRYVILDVINNVGGGQKITFDIASVISSTAESGATFKLVYDKLFQYIGEIGGVNNVQDANRSYTEVYAHIADHVGQTPDVLFRTVADENYKPNLQYPILPVQLQPEIIGAELFNSPIVSSPQNYPGSHFGQFDTLDFTYETSSGDSLRRSGDYYGVYGDINDVIFDASYLDGLSIDFDREHYVKMNIIGNEMSNFDEFNGLAVNSEPPKDFEFNAILWYYTIEDNNGNTSTNLYGISFLENPDNHPNPNLVGLQIPPYKKLVNNGNQDGTSYQFSLNLNFNIINENIQELFDPNSNYNTFSFNLFNTAMSRLASTNDSFVKMVAEFNKINTDISNLRQLLYTQTDFNVINKRFEFFDLMFERLKTNQIVNSDTIDVFLNESLSPPVIQLNSKDSKYFTITNLLSSDMYDVQGVIPANINVPSKKDFLVRVINDDVNNITLPNNDKLIIVLDRDLDYRQTVEFIIDGGDASTENKKLEIYITFDNGSGVPVSIGGVVRNGSNVSQKLLVGPIDLPIYFNKDTQALNSAKRLDHIRYSVDLSQSITIDQNILKLPVGNVIGIKKGDTLYLNNFILGTSSNSNFSGQYKVNSIDTITKYVNLDISNNLDLVSFATPTPYNALANLDAHPYLTFNKGLKYSITRVDNVDGSPIEVRYMIIKENI